MSRRLFHFLLAVVVAFVFTGRMVAAASPCRGLVAPDMAMSAMAGMDMSAMPDCHGAGHPGKAHTPASDPCECLALLTADFPIVEAAKRSARMATFIWKAPVTVTLTSFDRAPDGPPPKS